jgi:hypothetical protein
VMRMAAKMSGLFSITATDNGFQAGSRRAAIGNPAAAVASPAEYDPGTGVHKCRHGSGSS